MIETEWRETIAERHENRKAETHNMLPLKVGGMIDINSPPFNNQITAAARSSTAIAVSDTSMKNDQMGGY